MTDKDSQFDEAMDGGLEAQLDALLAQIESGQAAAEPPAGNAEEEDETDPSAGPPPAASPGRGGDGVSSFTDVLDAQLESLISAATEAVRDEVLPAPPPPEPQAEPEPSTSAPADAIRHHDDAADDELSEDDFQTPEQTLQSKNDDLADQIQELLNEAKNQQDAREQTDDADDTLDPNGLAQTMPGVESLPEVGIDDIDQMLADQADEALDDSFESVDEVMSGAGDGPEPAANAVRAAEHDFAENDTDAFASPEQVLDADQEQEEDPYASIEQLFVEQHAARRDDEAKAAADPLPAPAAPVRETKPAEAPPPTAPKVGLSTRMQAYGELARRTCVTINKPLERFPPELRNTIGYIGLATLANAVFLMLYGLLF